MIGDPMFLKCYHHLHLMIELKVICVKQILDEDSSLEFFSRVSAQLNLQKNLSLKSY
jgi:hypothetical protein